MTLPVDKPLVALAAGGSGGHVFPAEATARALIAQGCDILLLTDLRGAAFSGELSDVRVERLPAGQFGGGIGAKLGGLFGLLRGTVAGIQLFNLLRPRAVVGFGGSPSAGPLAAAAILRIPVIIHDQNAVLGRANKLFAPFASRIATSFPGLRLSAPKERVVFTGNPVRPEILALSGKPYPPLSLGSRLNLLITGGSQGARIFSDVVPDAIGKLPQLERAQLSIVQQCRPEDIDKVRKAYDDLGVKAELASFFQDMPARLQKAHLVIGRSGASTVAELAVAGRPAILVPLAISLTGDQKANAQIFVNAGGGWMIEQKDFTGEALAQKLGELLAAPGQIKSAAEKARGIAIPDAAERLAAVILQTIGGDQPLPSVTTRNMKGAA